MKITDFACGSLRRVLSPLRRVTLSRSASADYSVSVEGEASPRFSAHIDSRFDPTLAALAVLAALCAAVSIVRRLAR